MGGRSTDAVRRNVMLVKLLQNMKGGRVWRKREHNREHNREQYRKLKDIQ
jgi:uncharacterized protein YjiS (DUF1127 family)